MLFLDTSALVKRYVDEEGTELVLGRMSSDPEWAVSSVARTEAEITLCRLGFDRDDSPDVWRRLRDDWERCHVVPVDLDCLERAGEIVAATSFERLMRSTSRPLTGCRDRS